MSMSRATRQIVVAHLTDRGMSPGEIADELGVSRETVRRDLHNTPPPTALEPAPDEAPAVAPGEEGLHLPPSLQLGQDLRLLAASHKGPKEAVAEQLLHDKAEEIRARMRARYAAAAGT